MQTNKIAEFLYWLRSPLFDQGFVSQEYDKFLNDLLDVLEKQDPEEIRNSLDKRGSGIQYTLCIGDLEIWIANFPYSFGQPWRLNKQVLPKVRTRYRLAKFILNWVGYKQEDSHFVVSPSPEEEIKKYLEELTITTSLRDENAK